MCAGEAHWQNGIVEIHIGTFKTMLEKLILDYESSHDDVPEHSKQLARLAAEACQATAPLDAMEVHHPHHG